MSHEQSGLNFSRKRLPASFITKFVPRELAIQLALDNPNVIRTHSIVECGDHLFIFMQNCPSGDVYRWLDQAHQFHFIVATKCSVVVLRFTKGVCVLGISRRMALSKSSKSTTGVVSCGLAPNTCNRDKFVTGTWRCASDYFLTVQEKLTYC